MRDVAVGLARLGQGLRSHGIATSLREELDGALALGFVDREDREEVRRTLRIAERETHDPDALEDLIFSREYLLERPLLRAITRAAGPAVLLIDEVDRADDGFEAFLLEVLSDFQITVPELGTIKATHTPHVVLTSNRTREIGDALRRRCASRPPISA